MMDMLPVWSTSSRLIPGIMPPSAMRCSPGLESVRVPTMMEIGYLPVLQVQLLLTEVAEKCFADFALSGKSWQFAAHAWMRAP
jgi:hypothetical protein